MIGSRELLGAARAALLLAAAILLAAAAAIPPDAAGAKETPVRTLDDVTIEGEERLPQVLFISSRDAERPLDALAFFGPASPIDVGRGAPLPDGIAVPRPALLEALDPTTPSIAPATAPAAAAPTPDPTKAIHPEAMPRTETQEVPR